MATKWRLISEWMFHSEFIGDAADRADNYKNQRDQAEQDLRETLDLLEEASKELELNDSDKCDKFNSHLKKFHP